MATWCRPGRAGPKTPYGAEIERRLDVRPRRRGLEIGFRHLHLGAAGAARNRPSLRGTVELHFTYDEEAGGDIGPGWLLGEGISKPDYAIGAGFSYTVVNAHNGCLHLEVDVRGRSAHAAKPLHGVDALEAATASWPPSTHGGARSRTGSRRRRASAARR